MSDDASAPGEAAVQAGLSAGAMLRDAREMAGLHIGALAVSLKVPVKKLEALESDRIDLLPDAVFARALAASVCRTLKLDPGPVLSLLPGQVTPRLQPDARLGSASFDRSGMGWGLPLLSRLPKAVVVTASALVVGALALLFLPSLDRSKLKLAKQATGSAETAASAGVAAPGETPTDTAPAVAGAPVMATSPGMPGTTPAVVTVLAPPAAGVPAPAAAGASAALTATVDLSQASGAGIVVFKARGASWIEVTDAAGVVQLRKTMASGETSGASGAMPLSVTVGRADATDVLVRGKSFNLAPLTRDNVARFKVN